MVMNMDELEVFFFVFFLVHSLPITLAHPSPNKGSEELTKKKERDGVKAAGESEYEGGGKDMRKEKRKAWCEQYELALRAVRKKILAAPHNLI